MILLYNDLLLLWFFILFYSPKHCTVPVSEPQSPSVRCCGSWWWILNGASSPALKPQVLHWLSASEGGPAGPLAAGVSAGAFGDPQGPSFPQLPPFLLLPQPDPVLSWTGWRGSAVAAAAAVFCVCTPSSAYWWFCLWQWCTVCSRRFPTIPFSFLVQYSPALLPLSSLWCWSLSSLLRYGSGVADFLCSCERKEMWHWLNVVYTTAEFKSVCWSWEATTFPLLEKKVET